MNPSDPQPRRASQIAGLARVLRFSPHFAWLAVTLAGCGGSSFPATTTYEVKGKVILASGKPLASGRVTFVAADGTLPQASGEIRPDGEFSLTTRVPGDGAAPGKYKVRIEPSESKNRRPNRPGFPVKYVDEDSSGLVVTVQADTNHLEPIRLK